MKLNRVVFVLIFALAAVQVFARDNSMDQLKSELEAGLQGDLVVQKGGIPGQFALGGSAQHAVFQNGQMELSGGSIGGILSGFKTENSSDLRKGEAVNLKRVLFDAKKDIVRLVVATVNPREQVFMGTTRERPLQAYIDFKVDGGLTGADSAKIMSEVQKVLAPQNQQASR